ncbi:hypothetical protein B566_EDAN009735 [Ephemera danica]|nr:hypothetical protein B566_EDAN009735 [Ephemera danica]
MQEEIDVVSLGGGSGDLLQQSSRLHSPIPSSPMTISKPIKCSPRATARTNLPTNPSPSDKHTLQHCLTEAIAKRPQRVSVPPLRIRIENKKRPNTTTGNTTDNESSSTESASSSSSTRKRGKIHRRAATFDTASCSSTTSSPRKRGSRSGSDSEDSGKRTMHNTMERQRRVDLRIAFENLRTLLPKLQEQEKAPKVHILKEAGIYCRQLQMSDTNMARKAVDLKKKQAQLRDRVSQLRKSLAFKR